MNQVVNPDELTEIARLALSGKESDVRLYLAKLIRKYRKSEPSTAEKLEELLKNKSTTRANGVMRKKSFPNEHSNISTEDNIPLLKAPNGGIVEEPILESSLGKSLKQVVHERELISELKNKGLSPTSSIIFEGPPGVGKTMTARWLAAQLNLPFFILDLTAVMSSLLGKTGNNLRSVIDFAKERPCVLLLDEIDAIAKKRSDESDVGELKRLVTVMLQEIENWPEEGLLIAATNHSELVDPAIWRRFDLEVHFPKPTIKDIQLATKKFLDCDLSEFSPWFDLIVQSSKDSSYSDIKRTIFKLRKLKLLNPKTFDEDIFGYLYPNIEQYNRNEKVELAVKLVREHSMSKRKAWILTGVSRDTIRRKLDG